MQSNLLKQNVSFIQMDILKKLPKKLALIIKKFQIYTIQKFRLSLPRKL